MNERSRGESGRGRAYLVGAGPGDPGLITVRGLELLSRADVVVNDRLASPRLLRFVRPEAEIIYAGKVSRDHFLSQDEIIRTIIDRASRGLMVVRLKGGDPFVFGRGGEEAAALAEAGIEFEVVPGVSSAVAVPAYAGIPVTSRHYATSFAVVTGHEAAGKGKSDIRWDMISTGPDTLVFLMGVEGLARIVEELIANGRSADTPAAVIQWGTHPQQRTVAGTLSDIVGECAEAGLTAPAVTVVGDVVRLREQIAWFESRPLFGRRVIVTRAQGQASALTALLEELGAEIDEFPVIRFTAPPDLAPLDSAIAELSSYDWIIFTSANGVEWFVRRLMETGRDIRAMASAKLAAIGPKTAGALERLSLRVDYVPSQYVAEAVVAEFPEDVSGRRILVPRAKEAREEIISGFQEKGADIRAVATYETETDTSQAEDLRRRLAEGEVDVVTFTSASTVRSFFALAGGARLPKSAVIACIGPITAEAARAHGLNPAVVASEYTIEGLVAELVSHLTQHGKQPNSL